MESFFLEGRRYYQQRRTCSRQSCRCRQGELHGPYWYARDTTSGAVTYIGRELPPEVLKAVNEHDIRLGAMMQRRAELQRDLDALDRLIHHAAVSDLDHMTLQRMGFGSCLAAFWRDDLVPPGARPDTQAVERADPVVVEFLKEFGI